MFSSFLPFLLQVLGEGRGAPPYEAAPCEACGDVPSDLPAVLVHCSSMYDVPWRAEPPVPPSLVSLCVCAAAAALP